MASCQRTVRETLRHKSAATSAASPRGARDDCSGTAPAARAMRMALSAVRSRCDTSSISGQCEGMPTARRRALAPRECTACSASASARASPDTTISLGALTLARYSGECRLTSATSATTSRSLMPRIASMPEPDGASRAMHSPRSCTSGSASANASALEATAALKAPTESPATASAATLSAASARATATPAITVPSCTATVSSRACASSRRCTSRPRIAAASPSVARTAG